ncbi:UPF0259 membrane protein YciC [Candidatus Erwinia haradaeae]|uniref:UPF0259 membrane protein ERCISPPA3004_475 n=2 Tax=Candidatus Erwinia haradaeae TaxID=1922217 RepID=A0A451DNC4_9GAMM|nr:YciC family protein [Candidatus Erwinia haradaeae]VFP88239.1 UPF0259 membrane protein YciC [Candidatus Erwinia haradaeae]
MLITASTLYRDTGNFLRHQLTNIVLIVFFTSCVMAVISKIFMPSFEEVQLLGEDVLSGATRSLIEMVQNMPPEQQKVLLRLSVAGTLSSLVGHALLLGGMLSLISIASSGRPVTALHAVGASCSNLLRLLSLTFVMMLSIQIGFMSLVVPGVLLAITLALSPMVITTEKVGLVNAIYTSGQLGWINIKLIAPVVSFWILGKLLVLLIASKLVMLPPDVAIVFLDILSNFFSSILIIYLSRLYMLLKS